MRTISTKHPVRSHLTILAPALILAVSCAGCGKRGPAQSSAETPAQQGPPPMETAKALIDKQWYGNAVETLKDVHTDEAVDLVLPLLQLPEQRRQERRAAVEWLATRVPQRERIETALLEHLPRATWSSELEIAVACLARTKPNETMLALAGALADSLEIVEPADETDPKDRSHRRRLKGDSMVTVYARALEPLADPECLPLLLPRLPTSPLDDMTQQRVARILLPILQKCAAPTLLEPLQPYLALDHGGLLEPAAMAVAAIGTDRAVAALETRLQQQGTPAGTRRLVEKCLLYCPHPQARLRLDAQLADTEPTGRQEAATALAAGAVKNDLARICRYINDPDPFVRSELLKTLPILLPEGTAALTRAASLALESNRPRTALRIAETLADDSLKARAEQGLERLRSTANQQGQLDRWLYAGLEAANREYGPTAGKQESRTGMAGNMLITTYGGAYHPVLNDTVRLYGRGQNIVRVHIREGYDQPVYGVRIGDTADLVWEIHGQDEQNRPYQMECRRKGHAGNPVWIRFAIDRDGKVSSIDINRDDRP